MSKIVVHSAEDNPVSAAVETPSEAVIRKSSARIEVVDSEGRRIGLRKPRPLETLDFTRAAGGERMNLLYLYEVAHLKYVADIDGDHVSVPATELQLRALYQRLGDEGNILVRLAAAEHFGGLQVEENRETVKK